MQGFNKYYPPDYDPSQGSLNKVHGKHALGDRARKLDKGILIVRFELPFNIWCEGCGNHIGQGVRYNAEKSKVGMYYSTPILNFRCKCHLCQKWFEIRTDPQNTRYVVHSGAKQKNEDWDPAENGGVVLDHPLPSTSDSGPIDTFASLERSVTHKTKALSAAAHLDALEELSFSRWSDPYSASVALRSSFRKEKKVRVESEIKAEGVREKYGLGERVRKEDLRTPREPGDRLKEDREWEEAKVERKRREDVREGKRRKEVEQVGWRGSTETESRSRKTREERSKGPSAIIGRPSSSSSSSRHNNRPTPYSTSHRPSSSTSRHATTTKPPSASSKPPSTAVQKLAARVLLNSALKVDPFAISGTGGGTVNKKKERQFGKMSC